jgi:hypothetical protein
MAFNWGQAFGAGMSAYQDAEANRAQQALAQQQMQLQQDRMAQEQQRFGQTFGLQQDQLQLSKFKAMQDMEAKGIEQTKKLLATTLELFKLTGDEATALTYYNGQASRDGLPELAKLSPGALGGGITAYDKAGNMYTINPNYGTSRSLGQMSLSPPSYDLKEGIDDQGSPTFMGWDPRTGTFFTPGQEREIAGQISPEIVQQRTEQLQAQLPQEAQAGGVVYDVPPEQLAAREGIKVEDLPPQATTPTVSDEIIAAVTGKPAKGFMPKPAKGEKISIDPSSGQVTIEKGDYLGARSDVAPGMGIATSNTLNKSLYDNYTQLDRLKQVAKTYNPDFLKYDSKFKAYKIRVKNKLGIELTPDEEKFSHDFAVFKRRTIENINKYIKEITGAQMSQAEAERLMEAMPNVGSGFWDGDGPVDFQAKLQDAIDMAKRAVIRDLYIKRNGITFKSKDEMATAISLYSGVDNLINQEGQKIEEEIRAAQPGLTDPEVEQAVMLQLEAVYGVGG